MTTQETQEQPKEVQAQAGIDKDATPVVVQLTITDWEFVLNSLGRNHSYVEVNKLLGSMMGQLNAQVAAVQASMAAAENADSADNVEDESELLQ